MTKLILRIHFYYLYHRLEQQLEDFYHFVIPSLLQQTDPDFICFIDYDSRIGTIVLKAQQDHHFTDQRFLFVQHPSADSHTYLQQQKLTSFSDLRFIHLSSCQIYPKDMLAKIRVFQNKQKILLLTDRYLFNTTFHRIYTADNIRHNCFVYVCPIYEYNRLFKLYDSMFFRTLPNLYQNMPNESLNIDTITYHSSIQNSMVTARISDALARHFIDIYHISL